MVTTSIWGMVLVSVVLREDLGVSSQQTGASVTPIATLTAN